MASGTWPMCSQNDANTGPVPPKDRRFFATRAYKIETIISERSPFQYGQHLVPAAA